MTHKICILHSLASSNSITALNAVQTLLQSGDAKVNEREHNGLTALHVAAAWDHLAMCQLLLYYGADPFQTDIHGRTAYDVAIGETKKFFARAFKGLQKTDKSNRIMPRIGFLRALTQLFACLALLIEDEKERIPSDVLRVVKKFSDRSLKREFESRGVKIGPLTPSTRFAYELKLARVLSQMTVLRDEQPKKFSSVLESVIAGSSCEAGRKMDELVKNEFFCSENWREGVKATSFCYILIDPSLLESQDTCTFVQFLRAIFYIGKGKRSRPLQHLTEAVKAKQGGVGVSPVQMTNKLRRILDVWAKGYGIVSLHVFQNTIPVEAFTREAAMIDAIGISNLTNVKKGDYYGISKDWTSKEKALYGSYLLQKALEVFRVEGCRQLFENDVHNN
ncbi:unnamed protein product [Anisakis simplex]|uniref:LEM domain-containing protein n=1 Tax=Anisakis simplex TaxID=6269 RepID=A0A158PNT2_ANISI|nr:unnamed protein product [Anisakis simplex]